MISRACGNPSYTMGCPPVHALAKACGFFFSNCLKPLKSADPLNTQTCTKKKSVKYIK